MIPWLDRGQPFPPRSARSRAQRTARRRRRPVARAPARRVPPRHLPVVQRRPAGAVVEPRSAHGAASRASSRSRARCASACAGATTRFASTRRFRDVMRACAEPRDGQAGTWITDEMMQRAYAALHAPGYAHSVETWIDGPARGRPLRRCDRARVLRRIDVHARDATPPRSRSCISCASSSAGTSA